MTKENEILIETVPCPLCGSTTVIAVPERGYLQWLQGEMIEKAMPFLSLEERERLISGICPKCWTVAFGEDDE